jgi:hypothetical protein
VLLTGLRKSREKGREPRETRDWIDKTRHAPSQSPYFRKAEKVGDFGLRAYNSLILDPDFE